MAQAQPSNNNTTTSAALAAPEMPSLPPAGALERLVTISYSAFEFARAAFDETIGRGVRAGLAAASSARYERNFDEVHFRFQKADDAVAAVVKVFDAFSTDLKVNALQSDILRGIGTVGVAWTERGLAAANAVRNLLPEIDKQPEIARRAYKQLDSKSKIAVNEALSSLYKAGREVVSFLKTVEDDCGFIAESGARVLANLKGAGSSGLVHVQEQAMDRFGRVKVVSSEKVYLSAEMSSALAKWYESGVKLALTKYFEALATATKDINQKPKTALAEQNKYLGPDVTALYKTVCRVADVCRTGKGSKADSDLMTQALNLVSDEALKPSLKDLYNSLAGESLSPVLKSLEATAPSVQEMVGNVEATLDKAEAADQLYTGFVSAIRTLVNSGVTHDKISHSIVTLCGCYHDIKEFKDEIFKQIAEREFENLKTRVFIQLPEESQNILRDFCKAEIAKITSRLVEDCKDGELTRDEVEVIINDLPHQMNFAKIETRIKNAGDTEPKTINGLVASAYAVASK